MTNELLTTLPPIPAEAEILPWLCGFAIVVAGGVVAMRDTRKQAKQFCKANGLKVIQPKKEKTAMKRIYITMEGGLVTGVVTDDPTLAGLSVGIIDYDTDGIDVEEFERLPVFNQDGFKVPAFVRGEQVELADFDLAPAHAELGD